MYVRNVDAPKGLSGISGLLISFLPVSTTGPNAEVTSFVMKLAIIGAGPSSFYVASRLLSRLPKERGTIHVFDRLWAPHGLVRYGVAPDHPEVKNCTHKFDDVSTDPRFRFFGNVNVYRDTPQKAFTQNVQLPLSSLYANYSHLLFAFGCPLPAVHPSLPLSSKCLSALSVVHWYTQHPSSPPSPPLESTKHITLIGNGNVSLDVARMLLTPPDILRQYDVPQNVLAHLEKSTVEHVSIVARRGPFDAAFTTKELRELINLPNASMVPIPPELLVPADGKEVLRQHTRSIQLLKKGSKNVYGTTPKTWSLDFFKSPIGMNVSSRVQLSLAHIAAISPSTRIQPTGQVSTMDTDLVITSIGFKGDPSSPFYDADLGHIRTMAGRVLLPLGTDFVPAKNVYASGWAAMGAKGVLAATMRDAYDVADTILGDVTDDLYMNPEASTNPFIDLLDPPQEVINNTAKILSYQDWKRVDAEETRNGGLVGKERERLSWQQVNTLLGRD